MNIQKSYAQDKKTGQLYLVGTPIGNLEDMTFRAIRTLKEADLIAAEDTRQTRKLLTHFDIHTRLVSYHEHNKQASGAELIRLMLEGQSVALVTDAGLPAISDPGYDLVRLAVEQGVHVVPIPGANAALSALIASGLPTDRFLFAGFLPREKKELAEALRQLRSEPTTMIFYESPHRIRKTLDAMEAAWGDRNITLARELTKRYEEFVRGSLSECRELLKDQPPLGEYCIVVEGSPADRKESEEDGPEGTWWSGLSIEEHVHSYEGKGLERKEAMRKAAQDRGVSKRDIYNELLR